MRYFYYALQSDPEITDDVTLTSVSDPTAAPVSSASKQTDIKRRIGSWADCVRGLQLSANIKIVPEQLSNLEVTLSFQWF